MRIPLLARPLLAAALVAAALPLGAAEPAPPGAADPPPGQLLIASAAIQDPRFSHAVILLLRHDDKGAFGIAINRPLQREPIAALLAAARTRGRPPPKEPDGRIEGTIQVLAGGPVQPERGFVVHSTDYRRDSTLTVLGVVAMTADLDVLRDIGRGAGPKQSFFALGYTGWAAGQLEAEMARHDWFTTPADPALIFGADRDTLWERALARRTQEL